MLLIVEISGTLNEERGFGEFDTHSQTGGGSKPLNEVMWMESGRRDSKGTNITNSCRGLEVEESCDPPRPDVTQHIEEDNMLESLRYDTKNIIG